MLKLYDSSSKLIDRVQRDNVDAGNYALEVDTNELGIATGNYIYQIVVANLCGIFRQCEVMTAGK